VIEKMDGFSCVIGKGFETQQNTEFVILDFVKVPLADKASPNAKKINCF